MSKRNTNNNNTKRSTVSKRPTRKTTNTRSTRSTRTTNVVDDNRVVFDPSEYENRIYRKERRLKTIGVGIRRGDTRHGDYSRVVVWRWATDEKPSQRFTMSLAEARSLKSFLDRELQVRAR